jgi:hypothetical protein
MKKTKTVGTLFKTPKSAALAVAILVFCEKVKTTTTNVHMASTLAGVEIRDDQKNTLFVMAEKELVKKLFNFPKRTLSYDSLNTARFVAEGVSTVVKDEQEQTLLLECLLNNIEASHPRPWRLGAHHDRIIDASGKAFSFLPDPKSGLQYGHLESLIALGEQPEKVLKTEPAGSIVF